MRKSDFVAFVSTDYQDTVKPMIEELDSMYKKLGKSNPNYVGWGNGYVLVPRQCILYKESYEEIKDMISIPYNLSYSGMLAEDVKVKILKGSGKSREYLHEPYWCFGFDTYKCKATEQEVKEVTLNMREQIINICKKLGDKIIDY